MLHTIIYVLFKISFVGHCGICGNSCENALCAPWPPHQILCQIELKHFSRVIFASLKNLKDRNKQLHPRKYPLTNVLRQGALPAAMATLG